MHVILACRNSDIPNYSYNSSLNFVRDAVSGLDIIAPGTCLLVHTLGGSCSVLQRVAVADACRFIRGVVPISRLSELDSLFLMQIHIFLCIFSWQSPIFAGLFCKRDLKF